MSQLGTLIWLKTRLLRNSLRSSKAVVSRVASILGMVIAFAFALVLSLVLGFIAFTLTQPEGLGSAIHRANARDLPVGLSTEFLFFSIFGVMYLMWATVPLSLGGGKQFDAGKLLMYPITLRKLFIVDFISEFTTLHSVFLVPAVWAIAIGAGLGSGRLSFTLLAAIPATLAGVALSKWLTTIIGSLLRSRRARGETVVALLGVFVGLGAAAAGQLLPILFQHAYALRSLRWTPPGAAAFLMVSNAGDDTLAYTAAFLTLCAYALGLIVATYWIVRRAALGIEGRRKPKVIVESVGAAYTGWQLPLLSTDLSAIVEKELRYLLRNAQVRMMALMPLLVIFIRLINSQNFRATRRGISNGFLTYGSGLLLLGGVLYVFLILAGLSCNLFAFEEGGMRTFILSPIDRRKILLGKNLVMAFVALVFVVVLVILNSIIFRDMTPDSLLFVGLSFVIFAALSATIGNSLSIRFPKRMRYGKRANLSGVAGLFLIPLILLLVMPPVVATAVGYFTRSLLNEYLVLALFALLSVGLYALMINLHGRLLARREIDILEAVREPSDE
jgi:ABC-type transport system involved in multi-copper enzyme maturation permease subunit